LDPAGASVATNKVVLLLIGNTQTEARPQGRMQPARSARHRGHESWRPDSQQGKLKTKPDVGLPYHTSGSLARTAEIETRSGRMYTRIGSKLLIAAATGMLGVLPASACDGCACGGAGYGYYGYGPSWGYSSAYVVAPALNPAPVVAFVPAAPRVYYSPPVYGAYYAPSYPYSYWRSAGYGWRGRW
jgi:hypothetical protein